jgi:hypothetical protein
MSPGALAVPQTPAARPIGSGVPLYAGPGAATPSGGTSWFRPGSPQCRAGASATRAAWLTALIRGRAADFP